ncbi:hypothetical protein A5756_06265 [Mycobacterium sp. 852002-53434_SCH5985345]|uniref:hypothetical protein n=1 Tax=Mycobacterium sp. 852002-53434_SCH5985345 TaxID=1834107 RepID=UPI0007FBDB66|nr:hypothetical protein [Mycobacterium sp. 852002-53434_SCH5985345]OBF59244.1 hypothetical protein A5756_06265 [Mycobacterium sp. 852002-53434_SCH5985345]
MRYAEQPGTGATSEAYRWLTEREQAAQAAPGRALAWTPDLPGYQGSEKRLNALRAGEPVTVFAGCLPRWARDGVRVTPLTYAEVSPDGAMTFSDDPRQFVAEHGL